MITLFDFDGNPIHDSLKATEVCDREPCPADGWPLWTDLVMVRCGARDEGLDQHAMETLLGDCMQAVLKQVEWESDSDAEFDRAWAEFEASDPVTDDMRESYHSPEEWAAIMAFEADDTGEWPALPPIAGGSDEADPFEPGPEDLADYGAWSEDLDRRRATAEYLDGFNAVRDDASEIPA
jgi:hypothetical protein